jgi:hypothetical protein
MVKYRNVIFRSGASDDERCEATAVRARLLEMVIDLGDDETGAPDKMTALYEAEDGGIIVYKVDHFEADGRMIARWRRVASLEDARYEVF